VRNVSLLSSSSHREGAQDLGVGTLRRDQLMTAQRRKKTDRVEEEQAVYDEGPKTIPAAPLKFIDLFCGIGGFRYAFEKVGAECVSLLIGINSQVTYAANFGDKPHGDIHSVAVSDVPKHDVLCGGFPRRVQPRWRFQKTASAGNTDSTMRNKATCSSQSPTFSTTTNRRLLCWRTSKISKATTREGPSRLSTKPSPRL